MAQARRLFEGAAPAAALAAGLIASLGAAWAQEPLDAPPKGADYQTSVQCAGLHAALAVFSPNDAAKNDERHSARFKEWARMRAPEVNKSNGMVSSDIETVRKAFLKDAGKGRNATRWKTLVDRYNSQWNTCRNLSDVREYMAVDG
jgi:hypothetical protein